MASVFIEKFKEGYRATFEEEWTPMMGGLLIALLSILCFAWSRPWGVFGGIRLWGDWVFHTLGLYSGPKPSLWFSSSSLLSIGFLFGAFGSALLSRQFAIRMAPGLEIIKGFAGGTLMGVGAALAAGCNVGGFYTALSAFSMNGLAMMVGLVAGAYIGLRYLLWELERFPSKPGETSPAASQPGGFDLRKIQPFLGVLVFLAGIAVTWWYTRHAFTKIGGLLLFGMAFGLVIQRARFCFVRGFRDPFMTGDGAMPRAVAVSLLISAAGFALIKYNGFQPESAYVTARFWLGGLLGGVIFGIGMVVAGGCGSGTLWRVGEGQVKLLCALISFSLVGSLFTRFLETTGLIERIGIVVFLPAVTGYMWALILVGVVLAAYFWLATWNEETDKFTVF